MMKTGRGWWALAGMVLVSLALYVGIYFATVRTRYRGATARCGDFSYRAVHAPSCRDFIGYLPARHFRSPR